MPGAGQAPQRPWPKIRAKPEELVRPARAPRRRALEEDLRASCDGLQEDLQGLISEMDAAADGLPGLWQPG